MPSIRPLSFLSHRPWLISAVIVVMLAGWLALGSLKAEETATTEASAETQAAPLARVVYQRFRAQETDKTIELYGRTAAVRQARLGAEVAGKVVELLVDKGRQVKKGQAIVRLDSSMLETAVERARATLSLREKEYKAAQSLKRKGLQGEVAFTQAESALISARAQLKDARTALDNARITAPFDGIVDDLLVELGDFVGVGDPVASFLDLNKLAIRVDVSERHVQSLKPGQRAKIRLVDNSVVSGSITYIARSSSPATNTYPVEVTVDNSVLRIPAGMSAEVDLSLAQTKAIKVTPAMLALDAEGNLGVKVVEQSKVRFVPIDLVKAEQDGVWLSGFGDNADIIVVGQGFVRDGDTVEAVKRESAEHQE
jgi:multidrug efflux system membrane fusion protein